MATLTAKGLSQVIKCHLMHNHIPDLFVWFFSVRAIAGFSGFGGDTGFSPITIKSFLVLWNADGNAICRETGPKTEGPYWILEGAWGYSMALD